MTHAAKKITTGEYEYRGFNIINGAEDAGYTVWRIAKASSPFDPIDGARTFTDAKRMIDNWTSAGNGA